MSEILNFIKDIGKQKVIVLAVFLTASLINYFIFYTTQNLLKLNDEYKLFLVVVMVFTGTLLLIWFLMEVFQFLKSNLKSGVNKIQSSNLSSDEVSFLLTLAVRPNDSLNIDNLNYDLNRITRIQVIKIANDLEKKGLIVIADFDSRIVWLTKEGIEKAFELSQR